MKRPRWQRLLPTDLKPLPLRGDFISGNLEQQCKQVNKQLPERRRHIKKARVTAVKAITITWLLKRKQQRLGTEL